MRAAGVTHLQLIWPLLRVSAVAAVLVGLVTLVVGPRAELELSRLDDRLIDIERRRGRARSALAEWIGEEARRPIATNLPRWTTLPQLADLQQGLHQHPALLAADTQVDASDTGVKIADERSKPNWALDVGYGYREGNLPSGEPRSDLVTVGVTVGLPFFRKKSVDSTLTAALQERSAARSSKLRSAVRRRRSRLSPKS